MLARADAGSGRHKLHDPASQLATLRIYNLAEPGSVAMDPGEKEVFRSPEAWRGTLSADFGGVLRLTSYRIDGPVSEFAPVSKIGLPDHRRVEEARDDPHRRPAGAA